MGSLIAGRPSVKAPPAKRRTRSLTPQQQNDRQGKKAERELQEACKARGGIVFRLYDTKDYQERIGRSLARCVIAWDEWISKILSGFPKLLRQAHNCGPYIDLQESIRAYEYQRQLMAQKQPADFLWLSNGRCIFIEVKSTKYNLGLPTGNLKKSQLDAGVQVVANDGLHYYFVIWYPAKKGKDPAAYLIWTPDLYHCYLEANGHIPWHVIKRIGTRCILRKGAEKDAYGARWEIDFVFQSKLGDE